MTLLLKICIAMSVAWAQMVEFEVPVFEESMKERSAEKPAPQGAERCSEIRESFGEGETELDCEVSTLPDEKAFAEAVASRGSKTTVR